MEVLMLRKSIAFLFISIFCIAAPAYANHEGPYVVGEIKNVQGIEGCMGREDMLSVFHKLPDRLALVAEFNRLVAEKKCGIFTGSAKIIGQLEKDVLDNQDAPWRIIQIEYYGTDALFEGYLIAWGTENIVIRKEFLQ